VVVVDGRLVVVDGGWRRAVCGRPAWLWLGREGGNNYCTLRCEFGRRCCIKSTAFLRFEARRSGRGYCDVSLALAFGYLVWRYADPLRS
jgi:hypothetical protein